MGDSFDAWYARHHAGLLSSLSVIADPDVAREATDEAFARACERWTRVGAMESPAGWVYRTALNVLRRRARRAALERRLLGRAGRSDETAPAGWSVEVLDAMRSLPERARVAVALRYVADLSTDQIAEVMGIAPGTVGSTLHAARRHLAAALGDTTNVAVVELEEVRDANA